MGPFELGDYVGLDTTKFIIDGEWQNHWRRTRFCYYKYNDDDDNSNNNDNNILLPSKRGINRRQ